MVSVDWEKAFDKLDIELLCKIMKILGYSDTFINFLKKIYETTQSIISNNDYPSSPFLLSRRLWQGWPLSILLYIINSQVVNLNIKAKDRIVGYPISKQKESLKFSQHANNINFFVTTENSVVEI